MYVIRRRGWEIPEHQATPEGVYLNRRNFIGTAAGAAEREGVAHGTARG